MSAPCPHHCPPGSGGGNGGPLVALVAVILAVAVLAGPVSHAITAALTAAIDVVEIAAVTLGSAAALAALAGLTVLARRIIRHRRRVDSRPTVIAQPAQAHLVHRAPLTVRQLRPLPGLMGTWRPGDIPARYRQQVTCRAGRQAAAMTTWRTDDPCPVCGTGLHATGDGTPVVRQDCPQCGWSTTWQTPEGR
jgi:hypothetical protein